MRKINKCSRKWPGARRNPSCKRGAAAIRHLSRRGRATAGRLLAWLLKRLGRNGLALAVVLGERARFVDRFAGEAGYFVHEEIPRKGRTAGIGGRGLEGLTDALLKAYGT